MTVQASGSHWRRMPLRRRLLLLVLVGAAATVAVFGSAVSGLDRVQAADDAAARYDEGMRATEAVEKLRERLRSDVLLAALATRTSSSSNSLQIDVSESAQRYADEVARVARLELPEDVTRRLTSVAEQSALYRRKAVELVELSSVLGADHPQVRRELLSFLGDFDSLERERRTVTTELQGAADEARAAATQEQSEAVLRMWLSAGLGLVVLLLLASAVARGLVRDLRRMGDVARAVQSGDLDARNDAVGDDELAVLARAFDDTADELRDLLRRQAAEAAEQEYARRLAVAFDRADDQREIYSVTARAMQALGDDRPAQLLLADSSRAHLATVTEHPTLGSPGCGVVSPWSCPAVRSGHPLVVESSHDLDACPKLRERSEEPLSAVCVPVTFMGTALGVLHAAGEGSGAPDASVVERMRTLAAQAGSRIGTVRALERAELQASTDGLTGLLNRRSFESAVRDLTDGGEPYAVVLIDLDHFKTLNDTRGHEAGDRALRLFAQVLTSTLRDDDLVCRWGGEEFALVLPRLSTSEALEVCARLRGALADAVAATGTTFTASFGVSDSASSRTLDEQVALADVGLLRAKALGRDRVVVGERQPPAQRRRTDAGRKRAATRAPEA